MSIKKTSNYRQLPKVIAVTGGKGGVGKTSIAVNLAIALANRSQQVILLDADLGLANIDIMLGIRVQQTIGDVLAGKCTLEEVMLDGPHNLKVVPASTGNMQLASLGYREIAATIDVFSQLKTPPNYLLIDTAAGITESVMGFAAAADEVVVVICDEPTSIADAYALIKLLNKQFNIHRFKVVTNKTHKISESEAVFAKLTKVTDKFLQVSITLIGSIPEDRLMEQAIKKTKPLLCAYPQAKSAHAIHLLANNILRLPVAHLVSGNMQFFQQQLIQG